MNLRRRILFTAPLAVVVASGAGFYTILRLMQEQKYDPHALPSPLIGRRPPPFTLPGFNNQPGFSSNDLAAPSRPMLVNWFASWCVPCAEEAQMLGQLAKTGLPIWGIAYQDTPAAIANYFSQYGNPFQKLATDTSGLTAINWGVYGVPESYLIDRAGIVRWRWAGALTDDIVTNELNPLLQQYS
jgi:cytochrome c biogenesis protein CcmG, thiol:disulfide interchange protein DsbE